MRDRFLTRLAILAAVVTVVSVAPVDVAGQAGAPSKKPAAGGIPRMPDGHPDLQGTYDLATLTPLVRPAGTPLVLTDEEATKREKAAAERSARADAPIDANRQAPPTGGPVTSWRWASPSPVSG